MRYNKIRKMDISNGPGIRVSIFFQGCKFHCKNCFNPETWSFTGGNEFTDETIDEILRLADKPEIKGLSMLGGEPMNEINIIGATKLAKRFKEKFKDKTVWSWSGYSYEDLKDKEVINYLDVLVDGQYKDELRNPTLRWRGSENQRVIDIKKTIKKGEIVFYKDEEY